MAVARRRDPCLATFSRVLYVVYDVIVVCKFPVNVLVMAFGTERDAGVECQKCASRSCDATVRFVVVTNVNKVLDFHRRALKW